MEPFIFNEELLKEIREKFYYVEKDHRGKERLFFENSGGSLRLKEAVKSKAELEKIAECPERTNDIAIYLQDVKQKAIKDLTEIIFGGDRNGAIISELTTSQVIFHMTRTIIENVEGKNVVTTAIEHPASYDAAKMYAEKMGMEFRVAKANPKTGGIDIKEIIKLVDKDTCLLSVISASNISGTILNIQEIVEEARKIKPDLHIITDAAQYLPYGLIDAKKLKLDGVTYAPYKHYGIRGCGFGYVSERVAKLPHDKLEAKPEKEWELGTYSPANFAALTKIVDYICWLGSKFSDSTDRKELYTVGMNKIYAYEKHLFNLLLDGTKDVPGLRNMDGVEVYFDSSDNKRVLIVAMGIKGLDYSQAVEEYYERGVTVFERVNTSLYSKRIVESLGLTGVIRVSPIHCHTQEEIERFLRVTQEITKKMKRSDQQ